MKNWEIDNTMGEENRKKAEDEIENQLRMWKMVTALYISKPAEDMYILYLKAGKWNVHKTNALDHETIHISESELITTETSISYTDLYGKMSTLRTTEGNPLKLKELFDRFDKKKFW